jgi:predicted PurR-regulated permease PerM
MSGGGSSQTPGAADGDDRHEHEQRPEPGEQGPEPGEQPPKGRSGSTGAPQTARALVPRWVQLVLLPIALLAAWVIFKAAGKVVVMFIVAAIIALILNPVVSLLQRSRVRRGFAVLAVYLGFFLAVAGIAYLLAHPIANQAQRFAHSAPHIVNEANRELANLQRFLDRRGIHVHLIKQGKTALQTLESKVAKSSTKIAEFGGEVLKEAAGAIFDVVVVFVLSVYMLLYGQRIGRLVRNVMPGGHDPRTDDYPTLVQRSVSRYVFGQLLFSFLMGLTTGLGLYLFGVLGIFPNGEKFALAFGTFYGFAELIPYIGPFLGAIPPVLVALFTGGPLTALWVALLFVGLQQLEGHVVAPQIFGRTLRINPLLVIFALLLGLQVRGVVGALVALPVLAILRETAVYLRAHLALEPWSKAPGPLL